MDVAGTSAAPGDLRTAAIAYSARMLLDGAEEAVVGKRTDSGKPMGVGYPRDALTHAAGRGRSIHEELTASLNQRFEETRRHFDVGAEGFRGEIRVVAKGQLGLGRQLQELREENESAHREILSAIRFP